MEHKRKRVDVVKIKMIRERSLLYEPRSITSPSDVVELCKEFLEDLDREGFIVISLDTKNQPVTVNMCSVGTLNSSLIHPREVFKAAILSNANSIIIGHNHPSGDTKPSSEDLAITERLKDAGEIIGIKLVDHIIIGLEGRYTSFKEHGYVL